jgi:hypothetical protein
VVEHTPEPGERWRVGSKVPRNLYAMTPDNPAGRDIGRMDTPELAALAVEAVNAQLGAIGWRWEYGVEMVWPDGRTYVDFRGTHDAAEDVLAAQAEIEGNVVVSRLVRRLIVTGPVEEVPGDG